MSARASSADRVASENAAQRIAMIDWRRVAADLDAEGNAVIGPVWDISIWDISNLR